MGHGARRRCTDSSDKRPAEPPSRHPSRPNVEPIRARNPTLHLAAMNRILLALLVVIAAAASLTTGTGFARVLQTSDAEHSLDQDWASTSCESDNRVQQVSSP